MGEDPGFSRAVSLHLARVLDEIGLNKLTVKRRRDGYLNLEQMHEVYNRLSGRNLTVYYFGSQIDGATTPGMDSDIDTLICFNDFNVIKDWVDWQQGKMNLLMLHEDTAPGYCRLQLLRSDVPMAREDLPSERYTYDSSGRVIMTNTWVYSLPAFRHLDRSGPAATMGGRHGFNDVDIVCALPCSTWPTQATEFIRRRRRYGWPSQRLLEEAVSHGVFLVSVGYKLSPTESLEWRISASMAERCLMFSQTIVHIKCYVVLKILVKTFIEPRIQKCISSYHCKTALLHCTETTGHCFWREDNLLQCITRCLEMLRNWVSDRFCPQFMISEENLFVGKVTVHNRDLIMSILTELINSDGRALLQVKIGDLGQKLQAKLNTEPSCIPVVDSIASGVVVEIIEHVRHNIMNKILKRYMLDKDSEQEMPSLIYFVFQNIYVLKAVVYRANKHERQALQTFISFLSCWLGSLLASFSLSHNRRVPRQAIQLMSTAATYDVASMLKLASVFYCSRKFGKVEIMLQIVQGRFIRNDLLVVCSCYDKLAMAPQGFRHMMHVLKGKTARAKLFAHCVFFSPHEVHCAPPALRHELCRSVGDDIQHRDPLHDKWMDLAVVDSLPYLYYLQYLTYKKLGKLDLQRRSLQNLDRCVREDHDFHHLETAWNLLGQCLEEEQDPDAAMACYRASLEVRPRNNAANWHIQNLRYKCIRKGCLPV